MIVDAINDRHLSLINSLANSFFFSFFYFTVFFYLAKEFSVFSCRFLSSFRGLFRLIKVLL